MTKSFVGKTLRGTYKASSRTEIIIFDNQDKQVEKKVVFECKNYEISIRFISIECKDCNNYDYNAEINLEGGIIPCIASVYKDGNIQIATHGKFLFNQLPDVRIDLRVSLIKCKGKYKYEIKSTNFDELTWEKERVSLPNEKQQLHGTTLFKTGSFKFSRY